MAGPPLAQKTARLSPEAGWAAKSDWKGPANEAGRTAGRNKVEDPRSGLRHAAAGLEGSAAHTAPPGKANQDCAAREGGDY